MAFVQTEPRFRSFPEIPNAVELPGPHVPGACLVGEYFQDDAAWEIERLIGTAFECGEACRTEVCDIMGKWWMCEVEPLENDFEVRWEMMA